MRVLYVTPDRQLFRMTRQRLSPPRTFRVGRRGPCAFTVIACFSPEAALVRAATEAHDVVLLHLDAERDVAVDPWLAHDRPVVALFQSPDVPRAESVLDKGVHRVVFLGEENEMSLERALLNAAQRGPAQDPQSLPRANAPADGPGQEGTAEPARGPSPPGARKEPDRSDDHGPDLVPH